jgi:hypothetical protein
MFTSAYFVTLETRESFSSETYSVAANTLVHAMQSSIGDYTKLCEIMHSDVCNAQVEVEVMPSTEDAISQITARALVRGDALKKLTFDKNRFTAMIRADVDFPVAIAKRAISKEELAAKEDV